MKITYSAADPAVIRSLAPCDFVEGGSTRRDEKMAKTLKTKTEC